MMFWKKKDNSDSWRDLIKILEIVQVRLSTLEALVEGINGKLRKKIYKETEDPQKTEKVLYNDGFDELRNLNKNG